MNAIEPIPHDHKSVATGTRLLAQLRPYRSHASVIFLCLMFCVIMWGGLYVHINLERERIIESKQMENDNLATVFEEHAVRTIRAAEITLREIASEYQRLGKKFDLILYAKSRSTYLDPYLGISIIDEKGDRALATNVSPNRVNVSATPDFQQQARINTESLTISVPRRGILTEKWTLFLRVGMKKADGSFAGYVSIGMDPTYFSKIYSELNIGKQAVVALVGRDGFLRVRTIDTVVSAGQNVATSELFKKLQVADQGSYIAQSTLDGVTRIFSYRALSDYPLIVVIGTSQTVALAEHEKRASRFVQGASGITLVIFCLGLFSVFQIEKLKRAEGALRALNADLEVRVQNRTADLGRVNAKLQRSLDDLQRAQVHLVQSEKMAALGGLVAGVAHEINTPVGVGVTAASHLQMMVRDAGERYRTGQLTRGEMEEFLKNADTATQMVLSNLGRAADLVRSFKQVAVDQSSNTRRQFRLKGYLEEVLTSLGPTLKRTRHAVNIECADELSLYSHPGAYSQIITNLVMNSVIHGFEGIEAGHITIAVSEQPEGLLLRYSDDGKGIAPEHLKKIFDPFFTTRRGQGGSGLGLHVVYNLVTQTLGGAITCESAPGQGVRFEIRAPMMPAEPSITVARLRDAAVS